MTFTENGATPIPTSLLSVELSWRSAHALDAHALLLDDDGLVRTPRDAVFFNAPRHPSQAVTLDQEPEPRSARLSVSLPRTESTVVRIVLGVSSDGPLHEVPDLTVTVRDAAGSVARRDVPAPRSSEVRALSIAEFSRDEDHWTFRPFDRSRDELSQLFEDFGIATDADAVRGRISLRRTGFDRRIDENPTAAPPSNLRPDWHPQDTILRWWDGTQWSDRTVPLPPADARICPHCGRRRSWRVLGAPAPCRSCAAEIEEYLDTWRARAWRVLTGDGPGGTAWEELWTALRYRRISEDTGRAALRGPGLAYVERLAAFADEEITAAEVEEFDTALRELDLSGPQVEELRRRMHRGRTLTRLRAGELPVVHAPGLHLDPEERVHLDIEATRIRQLSRGERATAGRLIGTNKKLRFVGPEAGIEMPWSRIVSVSIAEGLVALAATSARGGAEFEVEDPDLVAAILEGALRVAKRLTLAPGRRDTRVIPPEIKAQVWHRDGGACIECGATHYLEFDHVIPLSRGGATSPGNLQVLCRSCNRAKGARI
ncbi:TerD family protein [Nocardia sp. CA2R105]|uniref:TerD family protein n=1 Tax=Nocardia coffeae TaxID=2873381 RepID=UPI001CA693F3|nr:TerD family protein [Nocardia coffeae]MBY8858574.1 TerD family protein [Nocardia coffeae]